MGKLTAVIKKYDTCVVYKTLIQTSFYSGFIPYWEKNQDKYTC